MLPGRDERLGARVSASRKVSQALTNARAVDLAPTNRGATGRTQCGQALSQ
jgi:hypothetical protein